jgi:hypothetical protein
MAWQLGRGGAAPQRRRCISRCGDTQPIAAPTGIPIRPFERESPRARGEATPGGGQPGAPQPWPQLPPHRRAALTGPLTAAVPARRYCCPPARQQATRHQRRERLPGPPERRQARAAALLAHAGTRQARGSGKGWHAGAAWGHPHHVHASTEDARPRGLSHHERRAWGGTRTDYRGLSGPLQASRCLLHLLKPPEGSQDHHI